MDYKDRLSGLDSDYFTAKGQLCLIEMLFGKIRPERRLSILSVGCGDGNELPVLNKYGSVDIIDTEGEAIKLIPKSSYENVYVGDICQFKSEKKYDVVCGFDVLEHIEKDDVALERIFDLLSDDGYFVFTVPAFAALFSAHDKALNHFRRYDRRRLVKLLDRRFELVFLSYRYFFFFIPDAVKRILKKNAKPEIDAPKLPRALNGLFLQILRAEIFLMSKGMPLPIGINLVGIARKKIPTK